MNIVDVLIILGVLFFGALGFRDGLMKKIFGILGFLGGLILATKLMRPLADYIIQWLAFSNEVALVLSFFIIFIFVIILMNLFYRWFGQSGSDTLQAWSRLAGGILGAAQGLLAVSLILVMCDLIDIPEEESKKESALYEDSFEVAPDVFDYFTQWMPDSKKFMEEVRTEIDKRNSRP